MVCPTSWFGPQFSRRALRLLRSSPHPCARPDTHPPLPTDGSAPRPSGTERAGAAGRVRGAAGRFCRPGAVPLGHLQETRPLRAPRALSHLRPDNHPAAAEQTLSRGKEAAVKRSGREYLAGRRSGSQGRLGVRTAASFPGGWAASLPGGKANPRGQERAGAEGAARPAGGAGAAGARREVSGGASRAPRGWGHAQAHWGPPAGRSRGTKKRRRETGFLEASAAAWGSGTQPPSRLAWRPRFTSLPTSPLGRGRRARVATVRFEV